MATLVSVNVGMPKDVTWRGRTVHTGVWKSPVTGRRMVRRLNIDGDGQGDLNGHGGEQRAVLVYQLDSYRHWQEFFGLDRLEHGAFGENFTVDGLGDDEVCVGDRFRIGEAELEVTQPRVTCFRVGMRMGQPQLPSLLVAHLRPGFYLRVLTEGYVEPGDEIVPLARGRHEMSVSEIDALLYLPEPDRERVELAADIPALSPGWQASFRAILDADPDSEVRSPGGVFTAPPPAWAGFRTLRVSDVRHESETVSSYYLTDDGGAPVPRAVPGQYLTFRIPGAGDPVPVRTYSLSGGADQPAYRISVKRETQGRVSPYLHTHLRPGDQVEVAAPRGDFVLDRRTNPLLLISAGIGVTPMLAMLHELAESGSTREVWWIHTTHDAASHVFGDEAADLAASLPSARSLVYFTAGAEPLPSGVLAGRLTSELIAGLGLPVDASAYICGPEPFMDDVTAALVAAGVAPSSIRTERFGSRSAINPGIVGAVAPPPHQPPGPPGTGPEVTFARSGLSVRWSDDYPSVLELAEACDVPTQWSCRTGVCHTCVTSVLAGEAAYTTPPIEPPSPDEVLICSSRPVRDLVLDL
ncbi:MAG TPA: MOSC and FAD-binding oxidoreductase domain-containing protein [Nocardioides sp.]|uniref:MOSC and FAD-binding oxidoreductase domain-containing protein n=1 Tax=Nocardioides sp. TaxID=35761 RepID=UPI002F4050B2